MKFAKELEQQLVPEWRAKYFDYKASLSSIKHQASTGKKKLKAVSKALRDATSSPRTLLFPPLYRTATLTPSPRGNANEGEALIRTSYFGRTTSRGQNDAAPLGRIPPLNGVAATVEEADDEDEDTITQPIPVPEMQRLNPTPPDDLQGRTRYGSIIATPPDRIPPPSKLELPDPALDPADDSSILGLPLSARRTRETGEPPAFAPGSEEPSPSTIPNNGNAVEVSQAVVPKSTPTQRPHFHFPKRFGSAPVGVSGSQALLARVLHHSGSLKHKPSRSPNGQQRENYDVPRERYREFEARQAEFFKWMDGELEKIEAFYLMKEDEATDRLRALREQLHEMRDRRMEEIIAAQRVKEGWKDHEVEGLVQPDGGTTDSGDSDDHGGKRGTWFSFKDVENMLESTFHIREPGKGSEAMANLSSPPGPTAKGRNEQNEQTDSRRDFSRRKQKSGDVPYRQAKRKLKQALAEYYRGLELLKSYALLNRTAFRKMNKKYDKAVNARPTGRYMAEKVNKAYFVQSEVLDAHLVAVEDLYARYFEKGSHKVAMGKLRNAHTKNVAVYSSVYRNGLLLGAGLVFGIQGIVHADVILNTAIDAGNNVLANQTISLLQIYAGVFLSLTLFLLFVLSCKVWVDAKINYVFIFEFETRHNLDWRQLAEIPSLFTFLLGLFIWINFRGSGNDRLYIYYPVIMIALMVTILFFPAPLIYHRSRSWFLYSNWRLLLAGLYPVEFRDFYLGDHYCSQTYTVGNIVLFFCLYFRGWREPAFCSSSNSRLYGFFTTLPGIWRALQCIRRFWDTRNWFPHMLNCGKYTFTILYYMTLSLYRIDRMNSHLKALFIACAVINSVYTSIWDIVMDWSLGNPYAKNRYLREVLGFKQVWFYYFAMIVDPILRFNWVFYIILNPDELQHAALLSFYVSLSEILRRSMWGMLRMENEHCTNVGRFRASRDVPLPYELPCQASPQHAPTKGGKQQPTPPPEPIAVDLESGATRPGISPGAEGLRQRRRSFVGADSPLTRGLGRVATAMASAHAQDFERKRRPETGAHEVDQGEGNSSDEEEDGVDELEEMARGDEEDMDRQPFHEEFGDGAGGDGEGRRDYGRTSWRSSRRYSQRLSGSGYRVSWGGEQQPPMPPPPAGGGAGPGRRSFGGV